MTGKYMESYIVRVYRRNRKNPRVLAGVVEKVGREEKEGFENIDELKEIFLSADEKTCPDEKQNPR